MGEFILQTIYLLLPAYCGNMMPVFASRIHLLPSLDRPVDAGYKFFGHSLFGKNKTWRGMIVGTLAAIIIVYVQFILWQWNIIRSISYVNFDIVNPWLFGLLAGSGALGGDLIKSFAKRRFAINSGNPWPIFDQLDFVLGFFMLTSIIIVYNKDIIILGLILTVVLHPLTNILGYMLRIKKVWW